MMFHVPEKFRLMKPHPMGSDDSYGNNGAFVISVKVPKNSRHNRNPRQLWCLASDGMGWAHVSVHSFDENTHKSYTPTWDEMCLVKDLFWDSEDVVMQLHPAKFEYVNNHENVLHLWRPVGVSIPNPPSILVGLK